MITLVIFRVTSLPHDLVNGNSLNKGAEDDWQPWHRKKKQARAGNYC